MDLRLTPLDMALLDNYQREFPLVPKPFVEIAEKSGTSEDEVISRYRQLSDDGIITRIGAIVAPNTLAASTLAAMKVPEDQLEATAAWVNALPYVNHNYQRENSLNLWFVVTAPGREEVGDTLRRIERHTGFEVRDLRLEEPFHLDLGFPLGDEQPNGGRQTHNPPDLSALQAGDAELMALIEDGIPLRPSPYREIGLAAGTDELQVIERLTALSGASIVRRFGVIVRHRAIGMKSNAMVVWDIPDIIAGKIGTRLARQEGVTLCYRRTRAADWPFNIYCMVHGRSREQSESVIARLNAIAEPHARHQNVLFSLRCFKQTGARFSVQRNAA